jgi:type IV pilus assembly protein PilY1
MTRFPTRSLRKRQDMPRDRVGRRLAPMLSAFLATLMALPVGAVTIPDNPLQSGAAYPPANIMFILDDSGSMEWDFMPGAFANQADDLHDVTNPVSIGLITYVHNKLYYNPNTSYKTWLKADGTRYTGGTSYTSAYDHDSLLSTDINLANSTRTFYVPKAGATDLTDSTQFDRYQIKNVSGTTTVVRSATTLASGAWNIGSLGNGQWWYRSINVPAGAATLQVNADDSGGDEEGDLYVRFGAQPTGSNYDCRQRNDDHHTCTFNNPAQGTWWIGIYADGAVDNFDISYTVTSAETAATPTGRNQADELKNYATWYSYHRTRIKVAKAGTSEAFGLLGSNLRVGYDSIWNRSPYAIPVGTNDGLFSGSNRTTWFQRLHDANGNDGTPLKAALQRSGEYFENTTAAGPWGPATGDDQISCRQNFAILTTDGYWNVDSTFTSVGDTDGTAGPTITGGPGGETFTYAAVNPYYDNHSSGAASKADTLADVAMQYWKNDLRTDLANNVPSSPADPAFWQHMTTFGISIGLQGTLNPVTDLPSIIDGSKRWPNPLDAEDAHRIDDLWHAAVNGRGSFVAATNPTEFAQALADALSLIAARRGSASNVATNSTSFQSDTKVFQARYWSGRWTGEMAAYAASAAGVASEPAWQASQLIPAVGVRKVFTFNGTAGATFPTPAQVTALDQSGRALSPATGAQNAAYIKGNTTMERPAGNLRKREISIRQGGSDVVSPTVLGDIVNSSPIYIQELDTIFVGANDGMMHAFNATTGVERFAYVPAGINFTQLASLSDPNYVHRYFVDGPVAVSTRAQTPGKNYLVGALGRGGKGVFALDVTNAATPTGFVDTDVKWELTSGANMGQVLGEPLIVTLNDGSKGAIVGNGINSTNGNAVLFVINITNGSVLAEINTGVGGDNGMFAPRGWDDDGNGTVDYVYAGDRKGNLWRFDLRSTTSSDWSLAANRMALYQAVDDGGLAQPITAGLALARDPATGKRWVFVGTGSYLTTADSINFNDVQSMYGIIDEGAPVSGRTAGGDGDITERSIVEIGVVAGRRVRGFEENGVLPTGSKGWYIDLQSDSDGDGDNTEGERIVSNPRVRGTVLLTASMIPPVVNTCDAGGRGFINALDAFTGTSLSEPFFNVNNNSVDSDGDGVPEGPDFSDDVLGADGVAIGSVDLGVGMPTLPTIIDELLVVGGSTGSIGSVTVNPQGGGARRIFWREILRD